MKIEGGISRLVFVTKRRAFKVPTHRYGFTKFLLGWAANRIEYKRFKEFGEKYRLCPTTSYLFGFLLVMPRVEMITEEEFQTLEKADFLFCSDWKSDNLGKLNNKIVIIDYVQ